MRPPRTKHPASMAQPSPPRTPAALEGGRVPGRSWWAESRPHGQQGQTSHCPLSTTTPPSGPRGGCSDLCRRRASQAVSRCAFPTRGLVWLSCPCPHAVDFYTPSQATACLCWSCQPLSCLLARACLGCRVLPGSASPGPRLGAVVPLVSCMSSATWVPVKVPSLTPADLAMGDLSCTDPESWPGCGTSSIQEIDSRKPQPLHPATVREAWPHACPPLPEGPRTTGPSLLGPRGCVCSGVPADP